jgi:peptide/nickel transport system ATP-binding protein
MTATPILEARELVKRFAVKTGMLGRARSWVHAVDEVSFAIASGETLGVVGESGCGKSTTARLLVHLLEPDAGTILLDGRPIGVTNGVSLTDARRQVQMVFQDSFASLNPRLTVEASIAFGPRVHGVSQREATDRARSLLARVGLEPDRFAGRYPHELSGGQRQRVNIARALALKPRVVILDEAVSALDKSVEAQVLNLLLDLKAEMGLTYVFISHDLNVVRYMSDRVMVMYLGKIAEIGPVESIYDHARHPYTRALLSAMPSMNPRRRTTQAPLAGDPPNPIDPPPGCRFKARCGHAEEACGRGDIQLYAAGESHRVACLMAQPRGGHSRSAEATTA